MDRKWFVVWIIEIFVSYSLPNHDEKYEFKHFFVTISTAVLKRINKGNKRFYYFSFLKIVIVNMSLTIKSTKDSLYTFHPKIRKDFLKKIPLPSTKLSKTSHYRSISSYRSRWPVKATWAQFSVLTYKLRNMTTDTRHAEVPQPMSRSFGHDSFNSRIISNSHVRLR